MSLQQSLPERLNGLAAIVERVRAELRVNRRAAMGLLLVGGLVAVYGWMTLDDAVGALHGRRIEATHRLQRLLTVGHQQEWLARAEASGRLRTALESRLWRGAADGLVLAELQDWLTDAGRKAGLKRFEVKLETTNPKGLPGDYRQLTATITALDTGPSLVTFLDSLKREPRLLVVDYLRVRQQPISSIDMKLIGYAEIKPDELSRK